VPYSNYSILVRDTLSSCIVDRSLKIKDTSTYRYSICNRDWSLIILVTSSEVGLVPGSDNGTAGL
jgi:hypothetical protein